MKIGDLVRYKKFPHEELHEAGIVGLVISEPYEHSIYKDMECAIQVDVWWDRKRSPSWGEDYFCWEYVDEIEVVQCASSIR